MDKEAEGAKPDDLEKASSSTSAVTGDPSRMKIIETQGLVLRYLESTRTSGNWINLLCSKY